MVIEGHTLCEEGVHEGGVDGPGIPPDSISSEGVDAQPQQVCGRVPVKVEERDIDDFRGTAGQGKDEPKHPQKPTQRSSSSQRS